MSFKGLIRYQGPDGNIEPYQFYTPTITVAEPALVVSPTKMNVFYRVPNPVEVSGVWPKTRSTCASTRTLHQEATRRFVHRGTKLEQLGSRGKHHRLCGTS